MLHVATGTLDCFQKQFRAVDRFVSPESYSYRAKVLCQAARLLRWTLSFGLFVVTLCSSGPLLSTRISAGAVRSITLSFAAESGANSSAMMRRSRELLRGERLGKGPAPADDGAGG